MIKNFRFVFTLLFHPIAPMCLLKSLKKVLVTHIVVNMKLNAFQLCLSISFMSLLVCLTSKSVSINEILSVCVCVCVCVCVRVMR